MLQRAGRSNYSATKMRSAPVAGSHGSQSQLAGAVKESASMVKDGFRFTRAGFKREKMMTDEPKGLEGGGLLGPTGDADAEAEAFAPTVDSRFSTWAPNERDQFEAYLTRRQTDSKERELQLQLEPQPEPEPEPELPSGWSPRGGGEGIDATDSTSRFSVVVSGTNRGVGDPFNGPVDPFDDLANRHSQDVGLAPSRGPIVGVGAAGSHSIDTTNDAVVDSVSVGNLIDL